MFGFGRHSAARHINDWAKKIDKLTSEFQRTPGIAIAGTAEDMLVDYEAFIIWLRNYMMHDCDFDEFASMRPLIESLGRNVQTLVMEVEKRRYTSYREAGMDATEIVPMHDWEHTQMIPRLPERQRGREEDFTYDNTSVIELQDRWTA